MNFTWKCQKNKRGSETQKLKKKNHTLYRLYRVSHLEDSALESKESKLQNHKNCILGKNIIL